MAVSIGGVIYSVGMNTSSFEAGARKIQATEEKIRRQQKINQFESVQEAKRVTEMRKRAEEMAVEISARRVRLQKTNSKEERKELEALRKEYFKQTEAYESAVKSLKNKIEANRFNINIMKEEAEVQKRQIMQEQQMNVERQKAIASSNRLRVAMKTAFRVAGVATVALAVKKFVSSLKDAVDEAIRLRETSMDSGIFDPSGWTRVNQQLAKIHDISSETDSIFKRLRNSSMEFGLTIAEAVTTMKSLKEITTENNNEFLRVTGMHLEALKGQREWSNKNLELQDKLNNEKQKQKELEQEDKQLKEERIEEEKRLEEERLQAKTDFYLKQKEFKNSQLSNVEKLKKLEEERLNLKNQINIRDTSTQMYKDRTRLLEVESEISSIQKEQAKEQERIKKKAEDEAKKLADKQKEILLARQEFELQFRISKLEKGNAKQQAEAEALKNAIKRNELMKKYGYDIDTATRAMKAMRDLENQGKNKYSEKDIAKAKRVVERSQKGKRVGKKTLEQAQAILNGGTLSSDRVAMFSDVKALPQAEMQFADLPAGSTSPVNMVGETATPTLSATPTQQANSNNIFQQILDAINGIPDLLGNQLKEVFSE